MVADLSRSLRLYWKVNSHRAITKLYLGMRNLLGEFTTTNYNFEVIFAALKLSSKLTSQVWNGNKENIRWLSDFLKSGHGIWLWTWKLNQHYFFLFVFFVFQDDKINALDSQVFMTCSQKTSLFLSLTTQLTVTLETLSNILMKPPWAKKRSWTLL